MTAGMLLASLMLGGTLPLDRHTRERWAPSGAFRMPVGDPYQAYETDARPHAPGPFYILRGVAWDGERASHQGVDLASGSAGAFVRAAATGVVVQVADHGPGGGYGTFVVLAHRLAEGVLAYTVYAHLKEYSPRVRMGQCVQAGQVLGRVGSTGHSTGPHLHFEVRLAGDPEERWEFSRVEDPLAFVDSRLPTHRADTTGVEACLEWAECSAIVSPGARAEDAVTREAWWRMLAAAVRGPAVDPALSALDLRDSLVAARILSDDGAPGEATLAGLVEWSEVARDLGRARKLGLRAGPGPLRRVFLREMCDEALGVAAPAAHLAKLAGRRGRPNVGEAVVVFADLAGPAPEPKRPAAVKPRALPPPGAIAGAPRPIGPPAPGSMRAGSRHDSLLARARRDSASAHRRPAGTALARSSHLRGDTGSLRAASRPSARGDSLGRPPHAAPSHAPSAGTRHARADSTRRPARVASASADTTS